MTPTKKGLEIIAENLDQERITKMASDRYVQQALSNEILKQLMRDGYRITECDLKRHYFDLHKPHGHFYRVDYRVLTHGHQGISIYEVKHNK